MRTPVIAGNWKMNMHKRQALELVQGLHYGLTWPGEVDVIVAPPFTALDTVVEFCAKSYISVAGQNMHWEESGAFTGEISPSFLKDAGADYILIGHSERRKYFGETNEIVNKKIKAAFQHNLIPIVCFGETLEERERGDFVRVIEQQILQGLTGLTHEEGSELIIAYEPVWAIGTGKTATPTQAEEAHAFIRAHLFQLFSPDVADAVRILYGGSVKPKNSRELLSQKNIDGALVGGAALKAEDFIGIIKSANA